MTAPTTSERSAASIGHGPGLLVGILAGFASGALGVGGGLIVVPMLSAWLGVPLKRAVGTSLAAVLVTAVVAVLAETLIAPWNLRWTIGATLALTAIMGAWLGARVLVWLSRDRLAGLMALMLLAAALRMSGVLDLIAPVSAEAPLTARPALIAAHALVGLAAGLLAALFGIGGGILAVPALAILHPDWMFQACRATSLIMIIPASLAAGLLHHRLANVDLLMARSLIPGSALGAILGVLLANRVPSRPLELAFAALLILSAARLLRRRPEAP
jgi:uncharacterized membrane protein YfcA